MSIPFLRFPEKVLSPAIRRQQGIDSDLCPASSVLLLGGEQVVRVNVQSITEIHEIPGSHVSNVSGPALDLCDLNTMDT